MKRTVYKDIEDWEVLETKIIHDFTEDEIPFSVVKVKIGNIYNGTENSPYPIIRWISTNEYYNLRKNAGIVIW